MARTITVDCIGSNVLSITDDGAMHSVPLNSQIIRISEQGRESEYRPSQLPLYYNMDTLGGRLNIHDGKDRLIYCWRSLKQYQREWRSPSLGGEGRRRSRSPQEHAQAGIDMRTSVSSRASAHMQSGTSRVQCSTTGTYFISCIFRDRECSFSIASSPPFPNSKKHGLGPRPDLASSSFDYGSFKIKREDALATQNDPLDLTKDKEDYLAPAMTGEEEKKLLQITNNLMKTNISRWFQEPFNNHNRRYFTADNQGYCVVIKEEPMDLEILKRKLVDGAYASVPEYERGFRLIIDNASQWHGRDSEIAKDAQSLNAKFEEKMRMLSETDMEDPEYEITSKSSRPASLDSGPGDERPRRTRERRPRAAKSSV